MVSDQSPPLKVLLIDDDEDDYLITRDMLAIRRHAPTSGAEPVEGPLVDRT